MPVGPEAHGGIVPNSRTVTTTKSLTGGGTLAEDRTLELVNDAATPGNDKLYGTSPTGTKGWFSQPSGSGTPSDTVTAETSLGGASSNAGVATTYSRGDHTHGTPSDPVPAHNGLTAPHAAATSIGGKAIPSAGFQPLDAAIQTHITGTGSPHTAAGVGAEASGAVATHDGLATVHANATTIGGKAVPTGGFADASTLSSHTGAAAPHSGHVQVAGQLGGTAASPDVRGLRESGGQLLTMGAVADGQYLKRNGPTIDSGSPGGGGSPAWWTKILGCLGNSDPNLMLRGMLHNPIHATPTNISITVARCAYFRPPANITVNTIRFFGVGATTGVYHVAIYNAATLARVTADLSPNTAAQAWGSIAAGPVSLVAGTLYLIAVSVDTVGTTAGMACLSATTGRIGVLPASWPGNLDIDLATPIIDPVAYVQFAVTAGALPATLPTLVLQAAWTGGLPAIFLDNA